MATKTDRPRVLIEQWLPIAEIGAECMREHALGKNSFPPLNRLHVWWARRPLMASRGAILASLLPAYPTGEDDSVRPWPAKFRKRFPSLTDYKTWFLCLIGIHGDPVAGRKLVELARTVNKKLDFNPYGYPRAFTVNPSDEHLETLHDLLEWTWGTREITFADPMAGGGSIPFEALRYGLTVCANELNSVASTILKATLDYPTRFGPSLVADIQKYGQLWCKRVRKRLEQFYPLAEPGENIFAYIWARTVACRETGKPVPLSPNWWLLRTKGSSESKHIGLRLVAEEGYDRVEFQIVRGAAAKKTSVNGTVKGGTGKSPWSGESIPGDYIKAEAQAGRMGEQLIAVGVKTSHGLDFRTPTEADYNACAEADKVKEKCLEQWTANGAFPTEEIDQVSNYDRGHRLYGAYTWADFFSPRQKLAIASIVQAYHEVREIIARDVVDKLQQDALATYLAFAVDKCVDYNCRFTRFDGTRNKICNKFDKHNYAFKWSYAEFDAPHNLCPWALEMVQDAYAGLVGLAASANSPLLQTNGRPPVDRLAFTQGPAQQLSIRCRIC